MNTEKYFHGSPKKFDKFSAEFCGKTTGHEQYGSGFYFTTDRDEARGYAGENGYVFEVALSLSSTMIVPFSNSEEDKGNDPLTSKQIEDMIVHAPESRDSLWNYGDIDYVGYESVLNSAVKSYCGMNPLSAMNALGNDFYRDQEAEVLKNIKKFIGVDSILIEKNRGVKHIVVFDPVDISITSVSRNIEIKKRKDPQVDDDNTPSSRIKI